MGMKSPTMVVLALVGLAVFAGACLAGAPEMLSIMYEIFEANPSKILTSEETLEKLNQCKIHADQMGGISNFPELRLLGFSEIDASKCNKYHFEIINDILTSARKMRQLNMVEYLKDFRDKQKHFCEENGKNILVS